MCCVAQTLEMCRCGLGIVYPPSVTRRLPSLVDDPPLRVKEKENDCVLFTLVKRCMMLLRSLRHYNREDLEVRAVVVGVGRCQTDEDP